MRYKASEILVCAEKCESAPDNIVTICNQCYDDKDLSSCKTNSLDVDNFCGWSNYDISCFENVITNNSSMDELRDLDNIPVKIKKILPDAIIPEYQTAGSSGFDFHAAGIDGHIKLYPGDSFVFRTGIKAVIPYGYEIQVRPRSGLAFKYDVTVSNSPGTIDEDYRDEIMIKIINNGRDTIVINNGDRIAQGVLSLVPKAYFKEVDDFTDEDLNNDRGGGIGSTGI